MKKYIISAIVLMISLTAAAQEPSQEVSYRRSSLYQILVNHREQNFAEEIKDVFLQIPVSEHFNDHDLSVKVVDMSEKLKKSSSDNENAVITNFLNENKIAGRLVAKWFNRDYFTGKCDMELVKERGLYDASEMQKIAASHSVRGNALLEDAGADLIGNTFVIVNDVRYMDKAKTGKAIGTGLRILGALSQAFTGVDVSDLTDNLADMSETLKGFTVKVNTFLYQLEWNDDIANNFYATQYGIKDNTAAKENFDKARGDYKLKYIGKQESSGSTTSFLGVKLDTPTAMVRKACQRAIDENVANLQHNFEVFRTKSPIVSVDPIVAFVGLKEGITEDSRFEVVEPVEGKNGKVEYKRIGVIQPIRNLIWDNRYMAVEENAMNATLKGTTFKKVSGGEFFPGMLIREIDN